MNRLKLMIPPLPWHKPRHHQAAGERVVLLHGLWRSFWAMEGVASHLHQQGFEVLNVPYSSFRKSLDEIVEEVAAAITASATTEKITHFVTHSMGGIVLRCLADRYPHLVTEKIVMLAPPNQGSEVIDWLEDSALGRWSLGPGGMGLSTEHVKNHVPGFSGGQEVTAIMGERQSLPFFDSFLEGPHDGVVTVEGGRVSGLTRFDVVDADHTFIMKEAEVLQKVSELLQSPERL